MLPAKLGRGSFGAAPASHHPEPEAGRARSKRLRRAALARVFIRLSG
jgi:hypothetical protein